MNALFLPGMPVIANHPKSKYLTHGREYIILTRIYTHGSQYVRIKDDRGRALHYARKNFIPKDLWKRKQ